MTNAKVLSFCERVKLNKVMLERVLEERSRDLHGVSCVNVIRKVISIIATLVQFAQQCVL